MYYITLVCYILPFKVLVKKCKLKNKRRTQVNKKRNRRSVRERKREREIDEILKSIEKFEREREKEKKAKNKSKACESLRHVTIGLFIC